MSRSDPFFKAALPHDIDPAAPALVGVSGGRDSVALLHWLHSCGFQKLTVCHLDHGLRAESREEAHFVTEFAKNLGCAFIGRRQNVGAQAHRKKLSVETAARVARHAFFRHCVKAAKTNHVFLAHHADDQVETFLFNLLRGAGIGGLGGMTAVTSREDGLILVRPLLPVWRAEIDAYVAAHALRFCEDTSNASADYTRNRLRHSAIPALSAAMDRDVRMALWRTAELLREEDSALAAQVPEAAAEIQTASLRLLPVAIQRRVIHQWLQQAEVPGCGFAEVEAVRSLLTGARAKINLPGNRCARRRAGRIFLDVQ